MPPVPRAPHRPIVDPKAQPRPSLLRVGIAPVSLVISAGLFYALRWPMAGVVAVALLALLASVWLGPLLHTARAALDRDLVGLLGRGRPLELGARIHAARFFRWFGAPADVAERQGRARRAAGDPAGALEAYERALAGYERARAPLSVVAGLGHAAYEAGEPDLARAALQAARAVSPDLPELAARLAHLGLMRGDDEIELPREDDGETARLVCALHALRGGNREPARRALAEIGRDDTAPWSSARRDVSAELTGSRPPKSGRKPKKRKA